MASANELSFLPDGYCERKAQRRMNAICAVLFILAVGGISAAGWIDDKANKKADNAFAGVEEPYLSEAKRIDQAKQLEDKQKRMAHQAELTASLLEKVPRSNLLAEITNSMPAGVSLLDLNLESKVRARAAANNAAPKTVYEQKKAAREAQKNAASATAAAALPEPKHFDVGIKITGIAMTDVQVAQFINNLSRSTLLKDVNLAITEQFNQGDETLRKFQVEMTLNPDAEVKAPSKPLRSAAVEVK